MSHKIPTTLLPSGGHAQLVITTDSGSISASGAFSLLGVPTISTTGTGTIIYISGTAANTSSLTVVADFGTASPLDGILNIITPPIINNFINTFADSNNLYIESSKIYPNLGGTGRNTLTQNSLLLGQGTNPVDLVISGLDGWALLAATLNAPQFEVITSMGGTITFTMGSNSLNMEINITGISFFNPLQVESGGTGQTLLTSYGILVGQGSLPLHVTPAGTDGQLLIASTIGDPLFSTITSSGNSLTFIFGPNTLDINVNLNSPDFLNPLSVSYGGTGQTFLTMHGVLIGKGSLPVTVSEAGTNGQVLIASTTGEPQFNTITSTGMSLIFTSGPNSLNIDINLTGLTLSQVYPVSNSGTGRTILTTYGVLIGEGSLSVNVTDPGTNGQALITSSSGDPRFSTITSTGNSLTFTFGYHSLNIEADLFSSSFFNPLQISSGGTGQTLLTTYGVLFGEGSLPLQASAPGTNGQVLIASTTGDPLLATITSTGNTLTFTFGPDSLNIDINLSQITLFSAIPLPVNSGGLGLTFLTAHGVLIGEGSLPIHVSDPGTNGQILIGSTTGDPQFATITSTGGTLSFAFGNNSLNMDLVNSLFTIQADSGTAAPASHALSILGANSLLTVGTGSIVTIQLNPNSTYFNPLPIGNGGTGQTILTAYGVLLGEGSLNLHVTAAGTNGQIFLAADGADPAFSTVTSQNNTITFAFGPHSLNMEVVVSNITFINPLPVNRGGTGQTVLTAYGVLIGEGSLSLHVTNPGTNGQILIASTTGDPQFSTITSSGHSLSFTFGYNSLAMDVNVGASEFLNPLQVGYGGTGQTTLTAHSVLIGEGSLFIHTTAQGTNGQLLLASSSADPQFATLTSTEGTLTFRAESHGLNLEVNLSGLNFFSFLTVENGGTGQTVLTTHGVLIGEGSLNIHVTSAGTNGQVLIGSTTGDPQFATISSTGGTLTFTFGPNSLNIDINALETAPFNPLPVTRGGTGQTLLSVYGVLIGEGSLPVAVSASGTNGQVLIASTTGAPQFANISSTGSTLTFSFGPNGLNIEINLLSSFFTPLPIGSGGTGLTLLTAYGVLIGEGSLNLDVTDPATNGQVLIASTTGNPRFATITSTGGTITFTLAPHQVNIELNLASSFFNPLPVGSGGTGQTILTTYGVLIGKGSLPIEVTNPATNGQILIASTTGDPRFANLTSTGQTVTFSFGPNSLNLDVSLSTFTFISTLSLSEGGTGRTILTTYGVLIGEGSLPVNVTNPGTNGQVLIGSTTGDPAFATITSTGNTLTFSFGPNSLNLDVNLLQNSFFNPLSVTTGGTGQTLLTSYGVLIGEGSLPVHALNPGTDGQVLIASTTGDPLFATFTSTGGTISFTFGPNSLNLDIHIIEHSFFNPLLVTTGGTGKTLFTAYGVLIGEGSLPVNVLPAGTNGQTLIASTTGDPAFSTITSVNNTVTFSYGPNSLNIEVGFLSHSFSTIVIGTTQRTVLTTYGVLIGRGSLGVNVTNPGTNGQLLLASTTGDPQFATITSTGNTISFTFGPNSLNLDSNIKQTTFFNPLLIESGGTSRTLFTTYGVLVGEGSLPLNATAPGTNGQALIASTTGNPAFATITSSGDTVTFTFGPNSLNIEVGLAFFSLPFSLESGETGRTQLTAYGVLIGEGSLNIHVTNPGTNGQVLLASTTGDPQFATITSTGNTLAFQVDPNTLSLDVNIAAIPLFNPLPIGFGGTGETVLTAYGVLIGEGSLGVHTTTPATNGQILIASTTGDPRFSTLTSTGNTITFTFGPNALNLDINLNASSFFTPLQVGKGGTGQTLLTTYGVLIGGGSLGINVTAAGTNGQALIASTTGNPKFTNITSTGGSISFTFGYNSLNIEVTASSITFFNTVFPVSLGATGLSLLTTYGVLIGEGSLRLNVTKAGTNGQVLIASTTGDPAFSNITSTGNTLTFILGPNSLNIELNTTNTFFNPLQVGNGGTGRTILTTYGVLIGEGSLEIRATAAGTHGQVLIASTTGDPKFATLTSTGKTVTFTFGPNSLNVEVILLSSTLFNPLQVGNGGTGRTLLTTYGVLIGQGSLNVRATNPGTNGQLLIASTTGDPRFSTLTSTGGTLSFTVSSNSLNINVNWANITLFQTLPVSAGSTGRTLLTTSGVLVGEGSLPVNVTAPGSNGRILIASTTGDPAFALVSSSAQTLTFTFGRNSLNIDINPSILTFFNFLNVGNGGTGLTLLTTYGVLIGEGSRPIHVTAAGTNGQLLLAANSADPAFATITSTGNTLVLTFSLGSNSLNIDVNLSHSFLAFLSVENGGTGRTVLTTYGVLIGEGSLPVHVTAPGTNGQILIGASTADPAFANFTSTGNTLTFTFGPNSLNIEVIGSNLTFFTSLPVGNGGTGRTVLTTYGVLIGEGSRSLNASAPGTNGQLLIASTTGDPRFATVTSTGGTITFTYGPNSLNLELSLFSSVLFNPLGVSNGATGRTLLTTYGVLIGEGSLPVTATAPGTNGQALIGSTGLDPAFTTISSLRNTLTFSFNPNRLNIDVIYTNSFFNPFRVNTGGTGRTLLTTYGVLIGQGSLPVHVTAPGTNGQILIAATGANPAFATISSTLGTITFTFGRNSLNVDINFSATVFNPFLVRNGGTGRTVLTANTVLIGEGSLSINTSNIGTNGQVLIAATGADPRFATITSSGGSLTFNFGPNSLNIDVITGNLFFNPLRVQNGGTGNTTLASNGVLIGEGSLPINVTAPGTNGQFLIASTTGDPRFSSITSTGNSLIFTFSASSFNIDINFSGYSFFNPLQVPYGGTGRTTLTAYEVLCGGTTSTSALQSVPLANTTNLVLTSNGPGSIPTFQNTNYINQINVIIAQSQGSATYTPTGGMIYCQVECIGGGGGGGGVSIASGSGTNSAGGGGGGGGGYVSKVFTAADIGASQSYYVGDGGSGGSSGTNGTAGTASSFGAFLVASGGGAGLGNSYSATTSQLINVLAGGSGGTATGGDINVPGQSGFPGWAISDNNTLFAAFSGQGGGSFYLGAGLAVRGSSGSSAGVTSLSSGAGGNGAFVANTTGGSSGHSGENGVIIITEYIATLI